MAYPNKISPDVRVKTNGKTKLYQNISAILRKAIAACDICVFALYDPKTSMTDPVHHVIAQSLNDRLHIPANLGFSGIGVWYIVQRKGMFFKAQKILIHLAYGEFIDGQVGSFEGYWNEFSSYVTEDKWVQNILLRGASNDQDQAEDFIRQVQERMERQKAKAG
ncbi:MAG: hypothetical protein AAF403_04075 [Pseudomonadota bacterium]